MAKKVIANLNIQLGATSATLRKDFGGAGGAVRGFEGDVNRASSALNLLGGIKAKVSGSVAAFAAQVKSASVQLAAMAAGATVAALGIGGIVSKFEEIDANSKAASRLGTTTEALMSLKHAGDLAGTSGEAVERGLGLFLRKMAAAQHGSKEAIAAFDGLGLSVNNLASVSPAEAFAQIADKINELPTAAERARAAFAIFGKQGEELRNMFAGGGEGIRSATDEVRRFGLAVGEVDSANVEAANDAWTRAKAAFTGVANQVVIALAPAVGALADKFTEFGVALAETIEANRPYIESFALALVDAFGTVLDIGVGILKWVTEFIKWLGDAKLLLAQLGDLAVRIMMPLYGLKTLIEGKELGADYKAQMAADEASKRAIEAKRSQQKGLADAFDETAKAADDSAKAIKAAEAETKKWMDIGQRITTELATPFEKFQERVNELNDAFNHNAISWEILQRGITAASDELQKAEQSATRVKQASKPVAVGAAVRGTAEGFAAVQSGKDALTAMRDHMKASEDSAKRREAIQRLMEKHLADIAKGRGGGRVNVTEHAI